MFAALMNARSGGIRKRARTSLQNRSSGSAGVFGNGASVSPRSRSQSPRGDGSALGQKAVEPDRASSRAKSRRETAVMEPPGLPLEDIAEARSMRCL